MLLLVTMPTREADGKLVCTSNGSASFLKIPRISPTYPPYDSIDFVPSTHFTFLTFVVTLITQGIPY